MSFFFSFFIPTRRAIAVLLPLLALLSLATPARAGEGHDHGEAPAAAAGPALPRFSASSELFELVGVLKGRRLSLYLDHAADNAPVTDAKLELEIGGAKVEVRPHGEAGEFEALLALDLKPGVLPVTATVTTASDGDLLAGELDLHDESTQTEAAPQGRPRGWQAWAGWGAGAAAAALVLLLVLKRRLRRPASNFGSAA